MLRMIGGELRKLLPRRILILLTVLLSVNLFMGVYDQREQAKINDYPLLKERMTILQTVQQARDKDRAQVDAYYAQLCAEEEEQYRIWEETTIGDKSPFEIDDTVTFEFIAPYTYNQTYNDYEVLNMYFSSINNFPAELQKRIDQTRKNEGLMSALGIASNSKNQVYQTQVAEIYADLLTKTEPSAHLTLGWHEWFSYSYGMLLLFLASLLLVLQSGLCEKDNGMESILRVSKRGRWQRGLSKACAFGIVLTALVLIMRLCDLTVFASGIGLTSPLHAIQNVRSMTYCPLAISILTGVFLNLAGLILSAFCFSMICLICTALFRNAVASILVGGGLVAGNLLLYWMNPNWRYQFLGMFSLASGDLLLRCPDITRIDMGNSLYPYSMGFYVTLAVLLFGLLLAVTGSLRPKTRGFRQQKEAVRKGFAKLFAHKSARKKPDFKSKYVVKRAPRALRTRSMGLLQGELVKLLRPATILLLLALVAFHGFYNTQVIRRRLADGETKVLALIDRYGAHVTEESLAQMQSDLEKDDELSRGLLDEQYASDYLSGKITSEEYYDYQISKAQAQAELSVLADLTAHSAYLLSLEQKGIATELFYDGGYLRLFDRNFDVAYYLIIVVLCAGMFAPEFGSSGKNGFVSVLRTTQKGRKPVFVTKMGVAMLIAELFGLVFSCFDFLVLLNRYGSAGISAPLVCIERYENFGNSLTVGGYIALYSGVRLLAGLLLALWVAALSCRISSVKLNLPIIGALTLLPFALTYFGLSVCRYFDYTAFLDGDRLLRMAMDGKRVFLPIYLIAALALAVGTVGWSARKFCGKKDRRSI